MSQLFETIMMICFGISWPLSIIKSYQCRTTTGKSVYFTLCVLVGYAFGIANKLLSDNITYVLFFYVLNFFMVAIDIGLYIRNAKLDRQRQ